MRLLVSYEGPAYGAIEDTSHGLEYTAYVKRLHYVVQAMTNPERPEHHPRVLAGFMPWLARQVNNGCYYSWCVDEQPGMDQHESASAPA